MSAILRKFKGRASKYLKAAYDKKVNFTSEKELAETPGGAQKLQQAWDYLNSISGKVDVAEWIVWQAEEANPTWTGVSLTPLLRVGGSMRLRPRS